jgi:hypothetical protein
MHVATAPVDTTSAVGGAKTFVLGATVLHAPLWLVIAAAIMIAGASGAAGYYAGSASRRSEQGRGTSLESAMPSPSRRPAASTLPAPTAAAELSAPGAQDPDESARALPAHGPSFKAAHRAAPAPARELDASASARAQSLEEEVRVMRRVERALRDDDPRLAVELLNELDRSVPGGALQEERTAAFLMARCELGAGSGAVLIREFVQRHPDSVYFARVRQACTGSDAGAADTTDPRRRGD